MNPIDPRQIHAIAGDDILRRLPSVVNAQQRLQIDALVHCHDVMATTFGRLIGVCGEIDPANASPSLVASLFADAWSMVDQIDLARQVLTAMPGDPGPVTSAFLADAAVGRAMRNHMDHLSQRIPNIAGRTGASEALFGTVSFVRCQAGSISTARVGDPLACQVVSISRGTVPGYKGRSRFPFNTYDVNRPISNLRLSVVDKSLALDLALARLTDIIDGLSESIGASIEADIPRLEKETGHSAEVIRSPTPVIVTAAIPVNFPFGSEEQLASLSNTGEVGNADETG